MAYSSVQMSRELMSRETPEILAKLRQQNASSFSVPIIPKPATSGTPVKIAGLPNPIETPPAQPTGGFNTSEDPITKFNLALMSILQGKNIFDVSQQAQLQLGALQEVQKPLTGDLTRLSPTQQSQIQEAQGLGIKIPSSEDIMSNAAKRFEDTLKFAQSYGEEYAKAIQPSPETIEGYRRMLKAGQAPSAEALGKIGKYLTQDDWDAWAEANKKGTENITPPTSYREWELAGKPGTYQDWIRKSGLRPLPASNVMTLSEGMQIPLVLKSLKSMLDETSADYKGNLFGPIEGLKALNPWDVKHKTIDDDLRRASQVIGKYMEGGVLRKEDEEKYRKMLPQITDTITVAQDKLRGVESLLQQKSLRYLEDLEAAGFDISGFKGKLPGTESMGTQSTTDLKTRYDSIGFDIPYEEAIQKYGEGGLQTIIDQLGFNSVGGDTNAATMRTDRHNNPTAFTTDVAKLAGLKEGIDYVAGDSFGGGQYKTARLFGNPVATTIKVIDKIGFTTSSGKPRWDYISIPKSQWNKLNYNQKVNIIEQMYQREGNQGLLNKYFV